MSKISVWLSRLMMYLSLVFDCYFFWKKKYCNSGWYSGTVNLIVLSFATLRCIKIVCRMYF